MANTNMTATAMTEALSRFLDVDVARYKLISTNLANIDTPGYHTRDLDFRAELDAPLPRMPGWKGHSWRPLPAPSRIRCGDSWSGPTATMSASNARAYCWPRRK